MVDRLTEEQENHLDSLGLYTNPTKGYLGNGAGYGFLISPYNDDAWYGPFQSYDEMILFIVDLRMNNEEVIKSKLYRRM